MSNEATIKVNHRNREIGQQLHFYLNGGMPKGVWAQAKLSCLVTPDYHGLVAAAIEKNTILHINQDGLGDIRFTRERKRRFKEILRKIRTEHLPTLPAPFTGKMELHATKGELVKIIFKWK